MKGRDERDGERREKGDRHCACQRESRCHLLQVLCQDDVLSCAASRAS